MDLVHFLSERIVAIGWVVPTPLKSTKFAEPGVQE